MSDRKRRPFSVGTTNSRTIRLLSFPCRTTRQRKVRALSGGGPLRRPALPARIGCLKIGLADDTEDVVCLVVALLHPSRNIAAARNFPFVDVSHMAERL